MSLIPPLSPRNADATTRILTQLASRVPLDIPSFWHDVESVNVPIIKNIDGNSDAREVTFLWRSGKPLHGVYLFLNRVTDKIQVPLGLMNHIAESDIWSLTLQLPAAYRGTYTFTEIPLNTSPEIIAQLGGRFTPFIGQADPLNKASSINVRGSTEESILSLDNAPPQNEWRDAPVAPRGIITTSYPFVAGNKRRVRVYIPDVPSSASLGLLVLLDAEKWFDHVGVLGAIDAAISTGRIDPVAVLGIDNLDQADRSEILGGQRELVQDLASYLVPQVKKDYADRNWAGRERTAICGQSLGGVTALMAARHAPEIFGAVLSHSPSMWWTPARVKRNVMFSEHDPSWVSDHVMSLPARNVRIQLCVGSLEGSMTSHVQQLHQRLLTARVDSTLTLYTGGHDFAWWRGAIIDGLERL